MLVNDQLNRQVRIENLPKKVISLVPSQTELLVDLGLEDSIVGVTKFCVHPEYLRKAKTIIGGTKIVNFDKIRSLQPDLILCNKEENTKEMIDALEHIAPVHISDIYTIEDALELIEMYGSLFNVKQEAEEIIQKIKEERQLFQFQRNATESKKVAYFIWKEPWMVAADDTFINYMLTEAGFENAFSKESRYPEVSLDDERLGQVDSIFLSTEPFPFKQDHVELLKSHFPNKDIKLLNGEMFSWYGSRLALAYAYFSKMQKSR